MNREHKQPLSSREIANQKAGATRRENLKLFQTLGEINTDATFWVDAAEAAHNGYSDREAGKFRAKNETVPSWLETPFTPPQPSSHLSGLATENPETKNTVRNISGMIALETGLSILNLEWQSAHQVLERIIQGTSTKDEISLFCHLAHMMWYADQPWLDRDTYQVIEYFPNLTANEQTKDWGQIVDAAFVLATKLNLAVPSTKTAAYEHGEQALVSTTTALKPDPQAEKLAALMRSKERLLKFSNEATKAYFNDATAPGLQDEMARKAIHKNPADPESVVADATYDMNLMGFVALQEGIALLTTRNSESIADVLKRITSHQLSEREQRLLMRLAHATWFKGVFWRNQQTQKDLSMFEDISREDQDKAWDQIVAAANILEKELVSTAATQAA